METKREWIQLKERCEAVMLSAEADTEGHDIVVSMYADMLAIEMGVPREHPHEEITVFAERLVTRAASVATVEGEAAR